MMDNLSVAYSSRKLFSRGKRYSTIEKEGLAIVWGIYNFYFYLHGKELVLKTDHAPFIHMNGANVPKPRLIRWLLACQPYRFRVEYKKGRSMLEQTF